MKQNFRNMVILLNYETKNVPTFNICIFHMRSSRKIAVKLRLLRFIKSGYEHRFAPYYLRVFGLITTLLANSPYLKQFSCWSKIYVYIKAFYINNKLSKKRKKKIR